MEANFFRARIALNGQASLLRLRKRFFLVRFKPRDLEFHVGSRGTLAVKRDLVSGVRYGIPNGLGVGFGGRVTEEVGIRASAHESSTANPISGFVTAE